MTLILQVTIGVKIYNFSSCKKKKKKPSCPYENPKSKSVSSPKRKRKGL